MGDGTRAAEAAGHQVEDLQRIGVKFFLAGEAPDLGKVVPVFHHWIQNSLVDGLLIDVADYAHVPDGPGILLVAHEGNYGLDFTGGRPGVVYYRKQPLEGDLEQRLRAVCATALRAALLLEEEPALDGAAKLRGDELQVFANDRLLAPNDEATERAFRPALDALLDRLFDGAGRQLCRDEDPRERFTVDVRADREVELATTLGRLV